ncbi:MAG: hypothetical protein DRP09_10270 [Candidatus Thorarchaeota archaeon]|nr:MAG: hypothetical protein DRP09_10270 [Candidatus Thorarchaeota archaeon]
MKILIMMSIHVMNVILAGSVIGIQNLITELIYGICKLIIKIVKVGFVKMKDVKINITIYQNKKSEQIRMFIEIVSKIVSLLLTPKPKCIGREGSSRYIHTYRKLKKVVET